MAFCFVDLTDSSSNPSKPRTSKPLAPLPTLCNGIRKPTKQTTLFSFFNSSESNKFNIDPSATPVSHLPKRPSSLINNSSSGRSTETTSRCSSQSATNESISSSKSKSNSKSKRSLEKPRKPRSRSSPGNSSKRARASSPPAPLFRPPLPPLSRGELEARLRDAYACALAECSQTQFDRSLPNWKRVEGSRVSVDVFEFWKRVSENDDPHTRRIRGCALYCLSHYHSDHYGGLARCFAAGPIVCSQVY